MTFSNVVIILQRVECYDKFLKVETNTKSISSKPLKKLHLPHHASIFQDAPVQYNSHLHRNNRGIEER